MLDKRVLDRLFKNFYSQWLILRELRASQEPEAKLADWRQAEKPSMGWRKSREYDMALEVLSVALRLSPEDTERAVWEYINQERQPAPTQRDEVGV